MRLLLWVRFPLAATLTAALLIGSACDDDDPLGIEELADFLAQMTGTAERPDPVQTNATGTAFFDVQGTTVRYRIEVENIQNAVFAHIHVGGVDVAGPIIVTLFEAGGTPQSFTARGVLVEDTFTQADIQPQQGIATLDQLLAAMEAGNTYVNVHTTQNPPGEIRGQIVQN
jgi:hypothetical protein